MCEHAHTKMHIFDHTYSCSTPSLCTSLTHTVSVGLGWRCFLCWERTWEPAVYSWKTETLSKPPQLWECACVHVFVCASMHARIRQVIYLSVYCKYTIDVSNLVCYCVFLWQQRNNFLELLAVCGNTKTHTYVISVNLSQCVFLSVPI